LVVQQWQNSSPESLALLTFHAITMFLSRAELVNNQQTAELSVFVAKLKNGIWLLGVASWLFGITDRSIASFSDGYLSAIEIMQLFTASSLSVGCI